jgi:hypothetical protein
LRTLAGIEESLAARRHYQARRPRGLLASCVARRTPCGHSAPAARVLLAPMGSRAGHARLKRLRKSYGSDFRAFRASSDLFAPLPPREGETAPQVALLRASSQFLNDRGDSFRGPSWSEIRSIPMGNPTGPTNRFRSHDTCSRRAVASTGPRPPRSRSGRGTRPLASLELQAYAAAEPKIAIWIFIASETERGVGRAGEQMRKLINVADIAQQRGGPLDAPAQIGDAGHRWHPSVGRLGDLPLVVGSSGPGRPRQASGPHPHRHARALRSGTRRAVIGRSTLAR